MKGALIAAIILCFICNAFAEHEDRDFFAEDGNWIARKRETASSERIKIELMCKALAEWSGRIFDTIAADPSVILNAMNAEQTNRLAFIRQWHRDGKQRDELTDYIFDHCAGTEV